MKNICVFDLETSLDSQAVCKSFRLSPGDEEGARRLIGDEFPKPLYHRIIAIGRLEATFDGAWNVTNIACDSAGDFSEEEMILRFDERLTALKGTLVGFNSKNFDQPVLRYRAMMMKLALKGLASKRYFARYLDDAEDIMDILANFDGRAKMSLDHLSRAFGLPGKPADTDGSKLTPLIEAKNFAAIENYCLQDVILTYAIWLRHQRCLGLGETAFTESLRRLDKYLLERKPELVHLCTAIA